MGRKQRKKNGKEERDRRAGRERWRDGEREGGKKEKSKKKNSVERRNVGRGTDGRKERKWQTIKKENKEFY